jgi:molybdenum cofactor biosynthesis enzyme MoaA
VRKDIDLALTTNGSALAVKARSLRDAGLKRVTVSLDSLDDATFQAVNDVSFPVARVSTEGRLFTCLLATGGHDLRALMRGGCSDDQLSAVMAHLWQERADRYSELRTAKASELHASGRKRIEMSYIGG